MNNPPWLALLEQQAQAHEAGAHRTEKRIMTTPTTPAGMPRVPLLERWEIGFSEDRMREYGRLCYEAGRAAGLEDATPAPADDVRAALESCIEAMEMKQRVTMWGRDGDRAKFTVALEVARRALKGEL